MKVDVNRFMSAIWVVLLPVVFFCSCSTMGGPNRIAIDYTADIKNMAGGEKAFWPDKELKKAFIDYWSLRYSPKWQKAFEKEAPYFQDIVGRSRYEMVVRGTAETSLEKLEVQSIQKVSKNYYEVNINLNIKNMRGKIHSVFLTDLWVYSGQVWYHTIKDKFLFPTAL